ncbi:MAG: hypothetical protein ABI597_01905 [Gammaproteobacteria bacterium]
MKTKIIFAISLLFFSIISTASLASCSSCAQTTRCSTGACGDGYKDYNCTSDNGCYCGAEPSCGKNPCLSRSKCCHYFGNVGKL